VFRFWWTPVGAAAVSFDPAAGTLFDVAGLVGDVAGAGVAASAPSAAAA
jgi:hypothetical protein